MRRKFLAVWIGSALSLTIGSALAAGPNDGPQYPNMESHKQYSTYRNQDHNNPSPRYAVTTQGSAKKQTYRNQDHNNPSPRYAVSTKQPVPRTVATRSGRYTMHAMRRPPMTGNHG
jgi:hypothetical protein